MEEQEDNGEGLKLDDIPAEEVRKLLGMSRVQFVDTLNGKNGPRLITSKEEWYRKNRLLYMLTYGDYNRFTTTMLGTRIITIHRTDLEKYLRKLPQQTEAMPGTMKDGKTNFSPVLLLAEFQKKNDELREQNDELRAELEATKKQLVALEAVQKAESSRCDGKGFLPVVCRMRRDGKSEEDIAAFLYGDGTWFSYAQVGALLHPDESRVAADSMQQRARRLLGKA